MVQLHRCPPRYPGDCHWVVQLQVSDREQCHVIPRMDRLLILNLDGSDWSRQRTPRPRRRRQELSRLNCPTPLRAKSLSDSVRLNRLLPQIQPHPDRPRLLSPGALGLPSHRSHQGLYSQPLLRRQVQGQVHPSFRRYQPGKGGGRVRVVVRGRFADARCRMGQGRPHQRSL